MTENEIHIGTPNPECACCRKPFTTKRVRAASVRVKPPVSYVPIQFSFHICAKCLRDAKRSTSALERLYRRVQAYHMGEGDHGA